MQCRNYVETGLSAWIEKNDNQYVAHAIWQSNVSSALNDGFIYPAEAILSKPPHRVEYEMGSMYGQRGIKDLSTKIAEFNSAIQTPYLCEFSDAISLDLMPEYKLLNEEQCASLKANWETQKTVQLKDGKSYEITYSEDKKEFFIKGICSFEYIHSYPPASYSKNYHESILIQEIVNSHYLDKQLAKIWNSFAPLAEKKEDLANLSFVLFELRNKHQKKSKLNVGIRCAYNSIAWQYGDVVVLRGSSHEIVSTTSRLQRLKGKVHEWEYGPLKNGHEVTLLQPWENNGEYYSLDLEHKDTIIIGPEAALAPFHDKNYQIYTFEKMTLSQLDFFKVPENLRPKPSVLLSSSVFKQNEAQSQETNPITKVGIPITSEPVFDEKSTAKLQKLGLHLSNEVIPLVQNEIEILHTQKNGVISEAQPGDRIYSSNQIQTYFVRGSPTEESTSSEEKLRQFDKKHVRNDRSGVAGFSKG